MKIAFSRPPGDGDLGPEDVAARLFIKSFLFYSPIQPAIPASTSQKGRPDRPQKLCSYGTQRRKLEPSKEPSTLNINPLATGPSSALSPMMTSTTVMRRDSESRYLRALRCCGETILTAADGVDMVDSYAPTGVGRAETVREIDGELSCATAGRKGELHFPPSVLFLPTSRPRRV